MHRHLSRLVCYLLRTWCDVLLAESTKISGSWGSDSTSFSCASALMRTLILSQADSRPGRSESVLSTGAEARFRFAIWVRTSNLSDFSGPTKPFQDRFLLYPSIEHRGKTLVHLLFGSVILSTFAITLS